MGGEDSPIRTSRPFAWGLRRSLGHMGVCQKMGYHFRGVPVRSTLVFRDLYSGTLVLGNYQMSYSQYFPDIHGHGFLIRAYVGKYAKHKGTPYVCP